MSTRVLAAHPSPDGYGADLMFLEAVRGMRERGLDVVVTIPSSGPLVERLRAEGFEVRLVPVPVLRKALLRPRGLAALAGRSVPALVRMRRLIRALDADVVYVNTVTIPHWFAAARLAGRPAVGHVREAEDGVARPLQLALAGPLLLAPRVIANSQHTAEHLAALWRGLRPRTTVVYNGFSHAGPTRPADPSESPPARLVVVGRLSPRKGQHVAIAAVERLLGDGHDVVLELVGTEFPGYEWYVEELRREVERRGLGGRVELTGYRSDPAGAYAGATVVLVPSLTEPFGNVAVEGQLAGRVVVASATGGLREIVRDGETGVLVPPGDDAALAGAVAGLLRDRPRMRRLATAALDDASRRFGFDRYRAEVVRELELVAGGSPR